MSRPRWNIVAGIVIGSIALANIVSGGVTAAGLGVSLLAGWATGLLIRYLLGTDTTRPSGNEIAKAMTALSGEELMTKNGYSKALDIDHISAYALIVETGTKLAAQIKRV